MIDSRRLNWVCGLPFPGTTAGPSTWVNGGMSSSLKPIHLFVTYGNRPTTVPLELTDTSSNCPPVTTSSHQGS